MEARIEPEASMFETSRVLGSLLASSSILPQAWHHCSVADSGAAVYVRGICGNIVYVAFSAKYVASAVAGFRAGPTKAFDVVDLGGSGLFRPLVGGEGEEEEKVKVQALALHLYLTLLSSPNYQILLQEIKDKPVIFTGHSLGGSLASLAALHFLNSSSGNSSSCNNTSSAPLLCLTFGSPLFGNEAFCRAILRERLAGNFCHVVSQHDIVPRLLFCPLGSLSPVIGAHVHSCNVLPDEEKVNLHKIVSMHVRAAAMAKERMSPCWPFGNYVFCSKEGSVCIDNPTAIVQMLYFTFVAGIEVVDLSYHDIVDNIPQHLLLKKRVCNEEEEFDGGISLVLEASGIGTVGHGAPAATECLKASKCAGRSPNLICAELATKLGKITPHRAEIEWYKMLCDDDMGYYDSFKLRISPRKYSRANMNRMKLSQFWDEVIEMLQNNSLPYDFHKRAKWVNASQFYMLLVEPLDIAEYYRTEQHKTKGHYLTHGRQRRYEVFDKWWKGKGDMTDNGCIKRSKFAGLTQDSCFWARVEQAKELTERFKAEKDAVVLGNLCKDLVEFENYAKDLVKRKEVSIDVLAPRSSYSLWVEEWKSLKLVCAFCFNC